MRAAIVVVVLGLAALARADATADAQRLISEGLQLLNAGELNAARDKFLKARDLVPDKANPHRLVGMVEARLGHCTEAIAELELFIAKVGPEDTRRTDAIALRDRCRDELAPKVGTLIVDSEPRGAEVRLDDASTAPVGTTPYESKSVTIGHHLVFVRKTGFVAASTAVSVARNETVRVQLALAPVPVATAPPPARLDDEAQMKRIAEEYAAAERYRREKAEAAARKAAEQARGAGRKLRIAGPSLFAGGFVILGLAFSIVADANSRQQVLQQIQNNANSNPGSTGPNPQAMWTTDGDAAIAGMKTDTKAFFAMVGIAGATIFTGAGMWIAGSVVRSRAEERVRQQLLTFQPLLSPSLAGLAAAGRF